MDHRKFWTEMPKEEREALTIRTDGPGVWRLFLHWGGICLIGVLIYRGIPGWQLLLFPQGILIVFLFTLLHEAVHQTPFKTPWLNSLAGRVSGFMILLPSTWFKYFHFAHHRFTQIPGKDPELGTEMPVTWGQYARHISGISTWIGHLKTLVNNAINRGSADFLPAKSEARIVRESRWMIGVYTAIFGISVWLQDSTVLWCWGIPALLGQPFLRFYLLAEHGLCPKVANMFENTRTTFTNSAIRFLAWNMPYHTEHHVYPTVPFHKLPNLHKIMREQLINVENGYIAFNTNYIEECVTND